MKKMLTILLILHTLSTAQVFDGLTLFTLYDTTSTATFIIDNNTTVIHQWSHERGPSSMPYLLQDKSLIYPYRVGNPTMTAGGVGGGVQHISWEGEILWNFILANDSLQHHHDVEPLPNGNVLMIAWERKTAEEAFAMGRDSSSLSNSLNEMWSTAILEIEPFENDSGIVVWKWELWDHLIQDRNPDKPNYGIISEHPELMDINFGSVGGGIIDLTNTRGFDADWMHVNAVHYNPAFDQIVFSSRYQNEIYVIDHSTTLEEAASHTGGNSGKGGDFLYRWGNPLAYGLGDSTDQILSAVHGVNWIPEGLPGEGNFIMFNNFFTDSTSAVFEISPPVDDSGYYFKEADQPYGPDNPVWIYSADPPFFANIQSGSFRLPNGNTIITVADESHILEVDSDGSVVWEYFTESWIARAQKYSSDILTIDNSHNEYNPDILPSSIFPNPFNSSVAIHVPLLSMSDVSITVFDVTGREVIKLLDTIMARGKHSIIWDGTDNAGNPVSAGVYLCTILTRRNFQVQKMVLLK